MNILVTGGAGYIGSHTVRVLTEGKHRVTVLDNLSMGHREAVGPVELVEGSTADGFLLKDLCHRRRIEGIVHFAASSLVGESVRQPDVYYRNNVVDGLALLDAAVAAGVRYFVFSSSAAVYGEPLTPQIPEEHPTLPLNPYGATKLALEGALRWYGEAYGLRYTVLRYFNAAGAAPGGEIGEDHTPETHLIPLVLKTALGQRPCLEVFGNDYPTADGTCVRDYIHVQDLAEAHALVLEAMKAGAPSQIYNLGNGSGYSVCEVLKAAEEVVGRPIKVTYAARRPGDPAVLVAGAEKIKKELGWRPALPGLREIIETAWQWHSRRPVGYGQATSKEVEIQ